MKTPILASFLFVSACAVTEDADRDLDGGKADDTSSACNGDELRRVERPVIPGVSKAGTFGYKYRVVPGTDPDAPAVIFLPGGPGQTSIQMTREDLGVPARYPLVLTDPRGTGCNAPAAGTQFPDDFFTTETIASDVAAIVDDLAPQSYLLYGISYGTMLATVSAARIDAEGLPPPRAVVLEGVVARAFEPGEENAEYSRQWLAALARQDPAIQAQMQADPLPLGLTEVEWGGAIQQWLSAGTIAGVGNLLDLHLAALAPGVPKDTQAQIAASVKETASGAAHSGHDPQLLHLFERVGCREITETNFDFFKLTGGALVPQGDVCTRFEVTNPYDAAYYPVRSPIFYLNGARDPNTPLAIAKTHVDKQPQADRAFISIADGGHNPFRLNLGSCAPALWTAFEGKGAGVETALATCEAPTTLERFPSN